jgi:radical SAM protein with 4Fe4S-binding SPASM domain
MCINAEGSISACFLDWNHKAIIGNVEKDSLVDIWNGKIFKNLRIDHLKMRRDKYENCANCGQLMYATLDNIDMYAEDILKRLGD